jgi:hypothetical protein
VGVALPLAVERAVVVVAGVVVVVVEEVEVVVVVREVVVVVREAEVVVVVVVVVLWVAFLVEEVGGVLSLNLRLFTGVLEGLGEEVLALAACLCTVGLFILRLLPLLSSCCVTSPLLWVVPVFFPCVFC